MKELTFNIFAVSEAVVFQDDCHRIYTHRHLSHRAVLIFQASPYPEVLRDTFGSQGGSPALPRDRPPGARAIHRLIS